MKDPRHPWAILAVLFAINAVNFFDRLIIGALGEPIRREFALSDASLGLLSTAFTLLYAVVGIPFGRLADRFSRKNILAAGVFVWSLLTAASGIAQNYVQLFALRLGVGVGEASCAPAATSMISDLFPAEKRARAMSVFMLGLPIGIGLSFALSGTIAKEFGWRAAFFAAGAPGILLALAAFFIREPSRGDGALVREKEASPYRYILSSPAMWWLIASGAVHNFCLYALSSFMTPYMMRFHSLDIRDASLAAMLINGVVTIPGLLFGGVLGDAANSRRRGGALLLVAAATFASVPLFVIAITAGPGDSILFIAAMGGAFALMYFYYSSVYAAIHDIMRPGVRGTAMSVYFLAMYLVGGALGPYVLGTLSDLFTRRAAKLSGVAEMSATALEPFRGDGLRTAMYVVPVLCVALGLIMLAAARAVRKTNVENG